VSTLCPWQWVNANAIDSRKRWVTACKAAGYPGVTDARPGVLLHDFRRSAARNSTRSGTPEQIAMRLLGHRTASAFRRYRITDDADLQVAAARLDTFFAEQQKSTKAVSGRVRLLERRPAKAG
jgi:integrase